MINSRQIVDIIKDELNKNISQLERDMLLRVIGKIEILEEIDYVNQYKQPVYDSSAMHAANKYFK